MNKQFSNATSLNIKQSTDKILMLKYILLLSIVLIWFACKKTNNTNNTNNTLLGIYNEVIPYNQTTQLDFIDSNTVIISGEKLSNQPSLLLGTTTYQINNGQMVFYSDSSNIKDTTRIWFMKESVDSFRLSTCPFGSSCMIQSFMYAFKKK
jgi:hypothetical protein